MHSSESVRNRRRGGELEAGRFATSSQSGGTVANGPNIGNLPRLQLYDAPVPSSSSVRYPDGDHPLEDKENGGPTIPAHQRTTIKFKDSPGKPGSSTYQEQPKRHDRLDPISEHDKRSTVHLEVDETPPLAHERFRTPPQTSPTREPLGLRQENNTFPNRHRTNTSSSEMALLPSPITLSNATPITGDSQDDLLTSRTNTLMEEYPSGDPLTRSTNRTYPGDSGRTNSEDEMEAHESLVMHESDSENSVDVERTPTRNRGGVRLVQGKRSTPRRT